MENFSGDYGYNKGDINTFVDYVIKRTEDNILTINRLNEEINILKNENERLKKLEDTYNYINSEIRINAENEANLIIKSARDNASIIVNDALIKAKKIEEERIRTLESLKRFKSETKEELKKQLDLLDNIEIL